jgi:hypothetical protein
MDGCHPFPQVKEFILESHITMTASDLPNRYTFLEFATEGHDITSHYRVIAKYAVIGE